MNKPNESEIVVFRIFVARLKSSQNQLDDSYHWCKYLLGRLLNAVDISVIQDSLRRRYAVLLNKRGTEWPVEYQKSQSMWVLSVQIGRYKV